ncbi:MAG: response regulator [Verrucomicrobiales bacterium]|nr:response regulator [Verrucomicrobiales bacterium]
MSRIILTADDSASMREMINFTLQNAGYEVLEAADGREALAKILRHAPHLLITDLNMPHMDGLELIRQVRALPQCRYLPIVMLTAESRDDQKQAGRAAGASGWIVKPFRSEQLVLVAQRLLP